ncbi:phenolic glucoside malonyltransferase 1-like [Macadamia integrifolia]|uniref:phenolic glucoside malonyltransferase 1-like n=1 Tax=Macadamia integrifolia TaxID=60698 RepID=UPI001C4E6F9A|nr:phenolic glucoside malonyltransferase 1-like [Macadamia integrifolia]
MASSSFKPVKVQHRCKVAPPSGSVTPGDCTTLPLTFFDIHWLPLPPVELLFFYDFPYPLSEFTHTLLPHLKHTLSSTLIHFYTLAGNLSWPTHEPTNNKPIIQYKNGDSVSFTVAESEANFYHLSANHLKDAAESRHLVPHLPANGPIVPMLAIQVTVFPNSGICIGVAHHHSICDGRAFSHFMKTWASLSKLGDASPSLSPDSLPFSDRTGIKDRDGISDRYLNELDRFMKGSSDQFPVVSEMNHRRLRVMDIKLQPNMVRATFELNQANCRRLKELVFAQYKKKKDHDQQTQSMIPPSRLVSICAYTWVCLLKAEAKAGESNSNETRFVVNADCRARLDPPMPKSYFGNCVKPVVVIAKKTDFMRGDGFAVAAQLIGGAIHKGVVNNPDILNGLENGVSDLLEVQSSRVLAAAGSPQFGLYETDFGLGRPKKVEMASIDRTGAMFLKESSNLEDGGLEFDLVLNRKQMNAFVSLFNGGLNAAQCTSDNGDGTATEKAELDDDEGRPGKRGW